MDTHTHIFHPEIIKNRERIANADRGFAIIYGDGHARMADYEALKSYMDEEEIGRAVATSFCFKDSGLVRIANDYLLESARKDKRIIPFASVVIDDASASIHEAERCIKQGARGVGELAHYQEGFDKQARQALDTLAHFCVDSGTVMMLHLNEQVGHVYAGKAEADFTQVVSFIHDHPKMTIILAHMGGGICFYEFMPEVRKLFAKVYYDLAAVPFLYDESLYDFTARFLRNKVMFGSDFPLLTFSRYKRHIEKLDDQARAYLLFENGRQLFGD
jgi:uncharacterized protein